MIGAVPSSQRGRPLAGIATVLVLWVAIRLIVWESPWATGESAADFHLVPAMIERTVPGTSEHRPLSNLIPATRDPAPVTLAAKPIPALLDSGLRPVAGKVAIKHVVPAVQLAQLQPTPIAPAAPAVPSSVGQAVIAPVRGSAKAIETAAPSRWRADAWLFVRPGSGLGEAASPVPSYGASQAGAVLAYRVSDRSRFEPEVYARGSKALVKGGEIEVAAGVRAKPIAALPLRIHAEARATRFADRTEIRPSAYATAGFDEPDLVAGIGARGYAQAGYVGGRYETAFADGQVVADKEVAAFDLAKLRVGAGAWGGAQKGAERLDVGPSASIETELGGAPVRLSAEYRVRVAGNAAPGDGIAITLTTGF